MWWFIYWFSRLDKNQKVTTYLKNKDDKCFQYATAALNFDKIKKDPQKFSNIKPFPNKI